jgi:hypothetical protein
MSKIISITPTVQWQDLFKLEVRFDNGDFGTAFAKSQTPPYAVGEDVEYTKNEKGTVKIQRANAYGGGGYAPSAPSAPKTDERSASIIRQVALKSAVEYACAAKHDVNTILANAETFNAWMTGAECSSCITHRAFRKSQRPFLIGFILGRCVKPPFGEVFLCQLFCYICEPIRNNDTPRLTT